MVQAYLSGTGELVMMGTAPMPADVRAAIQDACERDGTVSVEDVAGLLAQAFHDEGELIKLMLAHVVISECARQQLPMLLVPKHAASHHAPV
jgi:hypothetical protein